MGSLYCHTTLIDHDGDICAVEGDYYEIIGENNDCFTIENEMGNAHDLTKLPDDEGLSYIDWFVMAEQSTNTKINTGGYIMDKKEIKRQANVRGKILDSLREAGSDGVTNVQLSKIAVRYGGSLGSLYKRGYMIDKEHVGGGVYKYTLVEEPDEEITVHKTALEMFIDGVDKIGLVDSKEVAWLLEELGLNVKRKANTYKKGLV